MNRYDLTFSKRVHVSDLELEPNSGYAIEDMKISAYQKVRRRLVRGKVVFNITNLCSFWTSQTGILLGGGSIVEPPGLKATECARRERFGARGHDISVYDMPKYVGSQLELLVWKFPDHMSKLTKLMTTYMYV